MLKSEDVLKWADNHNWYRKLSKKLKSEDKSYLSLWISHLNEFETLDINKVYMGLDIQVRSKAKNASIVAELLDAYIGHTKR
jgi:hypothetical protein